ncbi:MAG: hypothetical protein LBB56_01025, partial [Chitinispirillales bacterium]|nr:hypothetical protein [Chitinispirillales bacterium]
DIITKSFDKISFAEPKHENKNGYNDKAKFGFPVLYEKYLFFTPGTYPAIMRYDTENDSLDYFSDWVKPLEKISDGDEYYFGEGIVSEKKIILPAVNANAIVIFDMETCTSSITEIGYKKYRHGNFCFDGKNYWFAPRFDGPVVRWNPVTKEYKEFSNYPAGFESGKICFFKINYSNGYVWLLPYNANMALKINITEETIAIADEFQSECKYNGEAAFECNYYMSKVTGDKLYAHTGKSNRLIEYDFNTKQRREEAIAFSEETVERLTENHSKLIDKIVPLCSLPNDCCYSENVLNRLQGFLNYVTHDSEDKTALSSKQVELRKNIIANSNGRAGQAIYDYCKKAAINP